MSLLSLKQSCIVAVASLAAFAGMSHAAPTPDKDIRPCPPPDIAPDFVLTDCYHTADYSYAVLYFDYIGDISGSNTGASSGASGGQLLGWAISKYKIVGIIDEGKCKNLTIEDIEIDAGYNPIEIAKAAKKLDIPDWILKEQTRAHEQQHVKDFQNYPLRNFSRPDIAHSTSKPIPECDCDAQVAKLTDIMEYRAMKAQLEFYKKAIKAASGFLKKYDSLLASEEKKLSKLNADLTALKEKNANEKTIAKKEKDINHQHEIIAQMKEKYASLSTRDPDFYKRLSNENPENFMRQFYGNAVITQSGTKYAEAYDTYKKLENKKKKDREKDHEESLDETIKKTYNEIYERAKKCAYEYYQLYKKNIGVNDGFVLKEDVIKETREQTGNNGEVTNDVVIVGRPVCRPCYYRDPLGKCSYSWCPNQGNVHSEYQKKEGDYIPDNYSNPFQKKVYPLKK